MALLECRGLTVRFGGHLALDDVDVDAERGLVTGLIGPNGAGKTTLFNVVCGLLNPSAGAVRLDGRELNSMAPYKRARRGMARTFQRLELFGLLTVRENVMVAGEVRRNYAKGAQVAEIIERVGLGGRIDHRVDELPTGQARLVEIARALATRPRVLLLDEPASGLDDRETDQLGTLLRSLAQEGIAVLLVEHDVQLVMEVCDIINVLDFGRIIAVGDAHAIRTDEAVLAAYLGSSMETK
jgi:branched-chain amino acid transport system ATP-binding protein